VLLLLILISPRQRLGREEGKSPEGQGLARKTAALEPPLSQRHRTFACTARSAVRASLLSQSLKPLPAKLAMTLGRPGCAGCVGDGPAEALEEFPAAELRKNARTHDNSLSGEPYILFVGARVRQEE